MASCTFFGHRNIDKLIESALASVIEDMIINKNVISFYVGNQGEFDSLVKKVLKQLSIKHPNIKYTIVLAYMPCEKEKESNEDFSNTIYPDGLETTPRKFAVSKRNMWMLNKADCVITYVNHTVGGAANFQEIARKKGKTIINIADLSD